MYLNPNNNFNEGIESHFDAEIQALRKLGVQKKYKKGEYVVIDGEENDFILFVEQGAFRAFREKNDKEVTLGFSFPGDIDCCPIAFVQDLPSKDVIQSLSNSVAIKVAKKDINEIFRNNEKMHNFLSFMLSSYIETLINRLLEFKTNTAEENYKLLIKRQPDYLDLVPDKYIASYLGVSKERLSRIRKKLQLT